MKIAVKNIEANPYRGIKQYPIDRAKVEALKISIKNTSFWDNILVRPHPTKKDKYQLAYGHHRWITIKELGIKEVDIPVREIDDAKMVKIMAEENLGWSQSPQVMIQTIDSVRKFLNAELAKCKTYDEFRKAKFSLTNLDIRNGQEFSILKGKGVGKTTISKFLGGNWNVSKVAGALDVLDDAKFDKEAANLLPNIYQVSQFRTLIRVNQIPKSKQKEIAKKAAEILSEKKQGGRLMLQVIEALTDDKLDSKIIDIMENMTAVEEFRKAVNLANIPKAKQQKIAKKMIDNEVEPTAILINVLEQVKPKDKPEDPELVKVRKLIEDIGKDADRLNSKINTLDMYLNELSITDVRGLITSVAGDSLENLYYSIIFKNCLRETVCII